MDNNSRLLFCGDAASGINGKSPMISELTYCSLWRRLLVIVYDTVILIGLLMLGSALALPFGDNPKIALQDFWFTLWLLLVCFAYLGGCWHYHGMTVGMRAWRVKLINTNGGKISWPGCLLRFLVGGVSLGVVGLGFVWVLFDKKSRTWHDIAARTLLIKQNSDRAT
jgi:uncharacterized RDD family membrane protein YckC